MNIDNGYAQTLRNLVPSSPASNTEYISRDAENAGVSWDIPDRLRVITAAGQRVRALIHGTAGVGKSTELQLWVRSLSDSFEIIYIEISDVRGGIDAILEQIIVAIRNEGQHLAKGGRWDEVAKIAAILASGMTMVVGGGLGVAESKQQTVRELFARTMSLFDRDRPLLLLIDGLDRLSFDDTISIFQAGSPLFDPVVPSIVCTIPHAHVLTNPRERWDPRITDIWHLPAFSVIKQDGSPNATAVAALAQGLGHRLSPLPTPVQVELLQRVALMSGGIPRHAIQILRTAVLTGVRMKRVGPFEIIAGERELRQDLEQSLTDDDQYWLNRVGRGESAGLPPRLLVSGAIIPYEGPERRYFAVHPLLRPVTT